MSDPDQVGDADQRKPADAIECEAIEADPDGERLDLELSLGEDGPNGHLYIRPDFKHPVEIRFGRTSETSPCYLVQGSECPELKADLILIQPDVIAKDPRRGWMAIGGVHSDSYVRGEPGGSDLVHIGHEDTPQLRLGPDVTNLHANLDFARGSWGDLLHLNLDGEGLRRTYARVRIHPDDVDWSHPGTPSRSMFRTGDDASSH